MKKRIGIYFMSGANWLGGVYYLINLVNSFNYLSFNEDDAPHFVVFYCNASEGFIKLFKYPNIEFVKLQEFDEKKTFLKSILLRKNLFLTQKIKEQNIDGLYPFNNFPSATKSNIKLISWYPDLQHKFYPEYFTSFNLWQREYRLKCLLKNSKNLVVSSHTVKSHFDKFYDLKRLNVKVLQFVSLTEGMKQVDKMDLLKKYNIREPYFMVSNQFYKHKDHYTVLKAIDILKREGKVFQVVLTGKMQDYRDPKHISELKAFIQNKNLAGSIRLLGVIPRDEQLSLMKFASSVIQPSLFEGWSTVVEDVKSLNASIIASDIEIHKEQLTTNGLLFEASNANSLAEKMNLTLKDSKISSTDYNYLDHIKTFASNFLELFK